MDDPLVEASSMMTGRTEGTGETGKRTIPHKWESKASTFPVPPGKLTSCQPRCEGEGRGRHLPSESPAFHA